MLGRKFSAPSVELRISASNANRIVSVVATMPMISTGAAWHRSTNRIRYRAAQRSIMIKGSLARATAFDYYYFPNCIDSLE